MITRWAGLVLLACAACSRASGSPRNPQAIPPDAAGDSTDLSPDESAPVQWTASLDSAEVANGEHPRVVVRCESGQVAAYLVMADSQEADIGLSDRAVPVVLDSAPAC